MFLPVYRQTAPLGHLRHVVVSLWDQFATQGVLQGCVGLLHGAKVDGHAVAHLETAAPSAIQQQRPQDWVHRQACIWVLIELYHGTVRKFLEEGQGCAPYHTRSSRGRRLRAQDGATACCWETPSLRLSPVGAVHSGSSGGVEQQTGREVA